MLNSPILYNQLISPVRSIKAVVEFYNNSTLLQSFDCNDKLISFGVDRIGDESKFFGFGVCQKLSVHLIDTGRLINPTTADSFKVVYYYGEERLSPHPTFHITEKHRDEKTNQLSITAYDIIHQAYEPTVSEIELTNYTIKQFADAVAAALGTTISLEGIDEATSPFSTLYTPRANFNGSETLRQALNKIAEATQTIYFVKNDDTIVFKRLDISGDSVFSIDKEKYFTLENSDNRRLSTIVSTNELGNSVSVSTTQTGSTQYVRSNPFWDLREDVADILDDAITAVGGMTINQFDCVWRGNFLLEVGDKICFVTKDNQNAVTYLLNDTITYNGVLSEKTQWTYQDNPDETVTNPNSLGDVLNDTFAKVDKINKEIELAVNEANALNEKVATLQVNSDNISSSVSSLEKYTREGFEDLTETVAELTKRVNTSISPEDIKIQIEQELANGVDKVTTATGFTFDEKGLKVDKTDSEMSTTITEDGMHVYKNDEKMLEATNQGVVAVNLHAKTYLIIGTHSRFEDYEEDGEPRTGCFWIS